jgi:hypothetical protein
MLYGEIIDLCSQIHVIQLNTLCGQKVELLYIKLLVHHVTVIVYKLIGQNVSDTERSQNVYLELYYPFKH